MKLPRDLSGRDLIKLLAKRGFVEVRRRGSHVVMEGPGGSTVVVPDHPSLKVGTLAAILKQRESGRKTSSSPARGQPRRPIRVRYRRAERARAPARSLREEGRAPRARRVTLSPGKGVQTGRRPPR
ncbi:MAG TPA: type II toxin-antitoxin system HicA family toxin [Candidatus Thermoplasmatota archaeon]|nr:type II toxin-antitoxin system HicA family toxin [Candidatus Thermoplasmatota archaeon]